MKNEQLFAPFWGYYVMIGNVTLWQPNLALKMTADEQYEHNCRADSEFPSTLCHRSEG